ncbi:hypothetical protein TNIN_140111 [Trichonephila inaurata madagascariensis]|uniref:Uncharacterized protein n=1 Tax=Trichonephila inaurata madagascariensis TaxID=2747483 RepID=A0A8X6MLW9_9ARAC|nr:hypothetical protein TNIN_452321 [Trichonephila inaurata madagascariensis]GFY51466.1 hypothetical protein TNIN_140111 [Trichonephila inaurata madagascariensis]
MPIAAFILTYVKKTPQILSTFQFMDYKNDYQKISNSLLLIYLSTLIKVESDLQNSDLDLKRGLLKQTEKHSTIFILSVPNSLNPKEASKLNLKEDFIPLKRGNQTP